MPRKDTEIDTNSPEMIVIGEFLFLRDTRELRADDGETTVLRNRSAEVLACLAANANETVPEDALLAALGPDTLTAGDLERTVDDLRHVLRDTDHDLIETLPEKGYRLNAQPVAEEVREEVPHGPPTPAGTQGQRTTRRGLMALLFVLLLLALVLYIILWPDVRTRSDAAAPPQLAHHLAPAPRPAT